MTGTPYVNLSDVHGSNSRRTALRRKRRIGIVLFEACDLVGVSVVAEAFDLAARIAGTDSRIGTYEVSFLSRQGGAIRVASSLQVRTDALGPYKADKFDTLFVAAPARQGHSLHGQSPAPWLPSISEDATEVIYLAAGPPPDGALVTRAKDAASPRSKAFGDALSAALTLIRRDLGDVLARPIARELSIVLRAAISIALEQTETAPAEKGA
ncbi:hypothetical protein [Paraburkholderia sp. MM5477-R1]|uniref:hypothetical protein n=1 Tax=Paraburkholderia sp. MM5477-R1 TaxID=2991062 RepID=UPI003D1D62B5